LPLLVLVLPLAFACHRASSAVKGKKSSGKPLGEEKEDSCSFQIEDFHDDQPATFVHDNPLLPRPGFHPAAEISIRGEDRPELETHEETRAEVKTGSSTRLSWHEPFDRNRGSIAHNPPDNVALEAIVASNALQPVIQSEEEISATVAGLLEAAAPSSPPSLLQVHKETDQEPQDGEEEPRRIVLRHVHRPSLSKIARAHAFSDGLVIVPRDSVPRV